MLSEDEIDRRVSHFRTELANRRRYGLNKSQEALASLVEVEKQTISKYERGITVPDLKTFLTLCSVMDTEPNHFVGWDNESSDRLDGKTQAMVSMYLGLPEHWKLKIFEMIELLSFERRQAEIPHGTEQAKGKGP